MKISLLYYIASLSLFLISCKKIKEESICTFPKGLFVNTVILESCMDGRYTISDPHFVELNFKADSTVVLDNGTEKFTLPFESIVEECHYSINLPRSGELMFLLSEDNEIHFLTFQSGVLDTSFVFRQAIDQQNNPRNFDYLFNECVIAGDYKVLRDGVEQSGFVTILPNGQLNGLKPYLGYALCYSDECLINEFLTIDLIDQSGNKEPFYAKRSKATGSIQFYPATEGPVDAPKGIVNKPLRFELIPK